MFDDGTQIVVELWKKEAMMGGGVSDKRDKASTDRFTDIVLSWSLEDIVNENLYLNQVLGLFLSFNVYLSPGLVVLDWRYMIIVLSFVKYLIIVLLSEYLFE